LTTHFFNRPQVVVLKKLKNPSLSIFRWIKRPLNKKKKSLVQSKNSFAKLINLDKIFIRKGSRKTKHYYKRVGSALRKTLRKDHLRLRFFASLRSASTITKKLKNKWVWYTPRPRFYINRLAARSKKLNLKRLSYLSASNIDKIVVLNKKRKLSLNSFWKIKKNRFFFIKKRLIAFNSVRIKRKGKSFEKRKQKVLLMRKNNTRFYMKQKKVVGIRRVRKFSAPKHIKSKKIPFDVHYYPHTVYPKLKRLLIKPYAKKFSFSWNLFNTSLEKNRSVVLKYSKRILLKNRKKARLVQFIKSRFFFIFRKKNFISPKMRSVKSKLFLHKKINYNKFHKIFSILKKSSNKYLFIKNNMQSSYGYKLLPYLNRWRHKKKKNKGGPSYRALSLFASNRLTFSKKNERIASNNNWFKYNLFLKKYLNYRYFFRKNFISFIKRESNNRLNSFKRGNWFLSIA
jgi:hypothetical protein